MKSLLLAIFLVGSLFAQERGQREERERFPEEIKTLIEQHHTNMKAERERFLGAVREALKDNPQALQRFEQRVQQRQQRREQHRENCQR